MGGSRRAGTARTRQAAWYVSSIAYRWSDTQASDQADDDLFAYLRDRLRGAAVVDCGCGPGRLSEKLAWRGAGQILAVDANLAMIKQAEKRLAEPIRAGRVSVVHGYVDAGFFSHIAQPDIVVFKRSLYAPDEETIETLRAAVSATRAGGAVVVVQPERSLRRYAFGDPPRWRPHTVFHLFNRLISRLAVALRMSAYRAHSADELESFLRRAAGGHRTQRVPSAQQAYNLASVEVKGR